MRNCIRTVLGTVLGLLFACVSIADNLGDFAPGTTAICGQYTTYNPATGAPGTLAGTPALAVYKIGDGTNSATESTTGLTHAEDVDSRTGMNRVCIDTSADGTFYSAGGQFSIVITTGTVNSVSLVGSEVKNFSLSKTASLRPATAGRQVVIDAAGLADANMVKAGPTGSGTAQTARDIGGALPAAAAGASGGVLISGTNAGTTTLGALTVSAATTLTGNVSMAAGLNITQSSANTPALVVTGNGTGNGATFTSGSGATGNGIAATAASTNGNGVSYTGTGTGSGLIATAGATGDGLEGIGGSTSGAGLRAAGTAGNSPAATLVGQGSAAGFLSTGGATGAGASFVGGATSGAGVLATGTAGNSPAASLVGQGSAAGLLATGGATGHGIAAVGGATSGSGLSAIASTSGSGIVATGVGTTQPGIAATGGSTSSAGISATGGGTGSGVLATSGAGATGNGISATAASTNGHGISVAGVGTGSGVLGTGGATGHGMRLVGGSTSGNGISTAFTAPSSGAPEFGFAVSGTLSGTHSTTTADLGTNAPGTVSDVVGHTIWFPTRNVSRGISAYDTTTGVATWTSAIDSDITLTNGDPWLLYATAPSAGGGGATANEVRDAVLNADMTSFQTQGSLGQAIGDPGADTDSLWALVNTNINATISSRASQTSLDAVDDFVDTEVAAILAAVDTEVGAIKTKTDFLPSATAGAAGGVFIAGTNAATTITTGLTTTFTGNLTGSVASVTGAVGSVTGNVGGNVTGSVGSVTGAVGSVTGNVGGNVTGTIGSLATQAKADVNAEADTALSDIHLNRLFATAYDPASKPGNASGLLNVLVENDAGVPRFTTNSLENGPSGGGGTNITQIEGVDATDVIDARIAAAGLATASALSAVDDFVDTEIATLLTRIGTPTDFGSGTSSIAANLQDLADNGTAAFDRSTDSLQAIRDRGDAAWTGGGGGTADWTVDERAAMRTILGIPASGQTPEDPTDGILDDIRDAVLAGGSSNVTTIEGTDATNVIDARIAAGLATYDPPTRAEATSDTNSVLNLIGVAGAGLTAVDDAVLAAIEQTARVDGAILNCDVNTANFAGSTTTLACILTDRDGGAVAVATGDLAGKELLILSGAQLYEGRFINSTTWDAANSELRLTLSRALPATVADAVTAIIR